jgi:CheY-like chemotaxis protein
VNVLADKKILLVEDEALVVEMIVDMLVDLGATVSARPRRWRMAFRLPRPSNLMPRCSMSTCAESGSIRSPTSWLPGVPMVFATGYGAAGDYCKHGVVIDKPYTQQRLANALLETLSMAHAVGADAAPPKR